MLKQQYYDEFRFAKFMIGWMDGWIDGWIVGLNG